jgi:hypothetical protein
MMLDEKKGELVQELNKIFILNENLDEDEIKKKYPKLHEHALEAFGTWKKALRENGIKKRKLVENEKFYLYHIMKKRYQKYGEEALRPKNIEPEMKDRIVDSYKTLKALRNTIVGWNEDKVLYEVRRLMISGHTFDEIEKNKNELYDKIMLYFDNLDELKEEYTTQFSLKELKQEENEDNEEEKQQKIELISKEKTAPKSAVQTLKEVEERVFHMLKEINYYENEEVAEAVKRVMEGKYIGKQEVMDYLFKQFTASRMNGQMLTEEKIKTDNPTMYHAFKNYFKNLQEAFGEMTKKYIG